MRATARFALVAGLAVVAVGAALSASPQEKPVSPTADHMRVHFAKAIEAHDAVVRGDLASVRAPAEWLASHDASPELDKASASQIAAMRHAAKQAADAKDIDSAATAAASMLAACGTCHRAAGATPPGTVPDYPDVGGTVGHMLRHKHAIDLMMQGLIVPSVALFQKGADALKSSPLKTTELPRDQKLTRDILAAEDAIHLLADRASAASDQQARVAVYGQIIANCARCHGLHGRVWGPGAR